MSYRAKAYPYPVLSTFSNDFGTEAAFHAEMEASIASDHEQGLTLSYSITQTSGWLNEYIIDRRAELVLDTVCRSTLYRHHIRLDAMSGTLSFEEGSLYGKVEFTPLIIATDDNEEYRPEGTDSEFGNATFSVRKGDMLAIGESTILDLEFTRTLERDLVTIQYSSEPSDADVYRFQLDGGRIIIIAGESLRDPIGHMLANPSSRPYLFMSIYKDCIAAALNYLAVEGDGEDTELPWGRTLLRKLGEIGRTLDADNPEYQEISAQLLVNARGFKKVEAAVV